MLALTMVKWGKGDDEVRAYELYHRAGDRMFLDLPEGWVPLELTSGRAIVAARPTAAPRYRVTIGAYTGPVEVASLEQVGMRLVLSDERWRGWGTWVER